MEVAQPFVNPWRRAAVLAALVATLELVLLLVAGAALFGGTVLHHAQQAAVQRETAPPPKTQPEPDAAPTLPRAQTSVLVLNGNGRSGAAEAAAGTLRARGYRIGSVGNAPRSDYPTTIVMYRSGFRPEAQRLAHDLHVTAVGPLDGLRPADLMGAHVALVLGN